MTKINKRVAIVDDSPTNLKLMGYLVHQVTGQVPDCFVDPHAGLKALRTQDYDLLLLDHDMPKLTGLQVLQFLTDEKRVPTVTAIVTAVSEPLLQREVFQGSAVRLIQKPFDIHEFRNFIQDALTDK